MSYFEVKKLPPLSFPSVSGAICTFNSQYVGLPLKSHSVKVVATQSGSGTPSPSNPRPISGYSAINISHSDADTSNPTVYTIQIGSTVYGGYYDARTGVLTVTHGRDDMGTFTWAYYSSYNRFSSSNIQNVIKSPEASVVPSVLCEVFDIVSFDDFKNDTSVNHVLALGNTGKISARATEYGTDANSFKSAMSGHYIVYELATPQTIQLPPCPIDTLLGENNIWADTGETTLQYPKFG